MFTAEPTRNFVGVVAVSSIRVQRGQEVDAEVGHYHGQDCQNQVDVEVERSA